MGPKTKTFLITLEIPILILIDLWNFHIIFFQYTPKKFQILTGFNIVGRAWEGEGVASPHPTIFFKPSPSRLMPLHGAPSPPPPPPQPFKNETPLSKREAAFHEMIPRKSSLNSNLKSS